METENNGQAIGRGMILRDVLALDRTVLANERTLLAYVRTAVAFAGGGAALVHFFESGLFQVLGWGLIAASLVLLAVGAGRYLIMKKRLHKFSGENSPYKL